MRHVMSAGIDDQSPDPPDRPVGGMDELAATHLHLTHGHAVRGHRTGTKTTTHAHARTAHGHSAHPHPPIASAK
jgi:hypothetical protein